MGKEYNLGSTSDMKRFTKDMTNKAMELARESVKKRSFEVECPQCHSKITIPAGPSSCPFCRQAINLDLEINF